MIDLQGFGDALEAGAWLTVQLAMVSLVFGLILGLLGALAKTSSVALLRWLGEAYSTIVRGVPELLWVFLIYFGTVNLVRETGELFGIENLELNAFAAGVFALSLCFGAYATEVFRGALLSIPKGQREAGLALGLSRVRIFWQITLPQVWRIALPGLGNLFMILMKDTALVSVVGLNEIMRSTQLVAQATKQHFTLFMVAAALYLAMTIVSMIVLALLEKWVNRGYTRSAV
ncbi:ABC transporter permease [Thiopseudomonas alkaliphila]|uniref:ABC transporter permease n=1 Tax=Thiopseudomonas alkaliphila TaxID=1697053 RepID=UPI00069CD3BB|nr:ABC transporter permease [Thiopseudomonas alkaliphila]AKX51316.1 ABC transporter permease [Thiopseudomonas alkaliphila]AKX57672.1 ABC transporter permease [Thiopseudomonas alkaliphila]